MMRPEPEVMLPAYRHGAQTPWGGDGLGRVYGKDIPDERTGESLEVSVIPGLNSRLRDGEELGAWLRRWGTAAAGSDYPDEFPLLLKLIDARDTLSVQVHPDDAYARRVENKLGKTEAWVILHAEKDSFLVYGTVPGTGKEALKAASREGKAVEKLLRRVPVHEGEVYYIPSGTVHAIGAGLTLYEIQQSSDVTYRFYDWDRTDKNGNKRELHIDKAVDVTDVGFRADAAVPCVIAPGREMLLDTPFFLLERWTDCKAVLEADARRFRMLTALEKTKVSWNEKEETLLPGQTMFIPAMTPTLRIETGKMLLGYPAYRQKTSEA